MNLSVLPPPLNPKPPLLKAGEPRWFRAFPFMRTLREYQRGNLRPDFVAGLTTALFTIPQGMAYALIAGFPPAAGLATAVAASIIGAAFGSSEFLINGPTNAIVVMIAGNAALFAAQGNAIEAIVLLTLMIGLMQVGAGLLRLGSLTRFVSEPVLTGFTAGAGLYIIINQLGSFFGVDRTAIAPDLWGWVPPRCAAFDLMRFLRSLHGVNWVSAAVAGATLFIVRALQHFEPRIGRRLPGPFVAVVSVTVAVWALGLSDPGTAHRVRVIADIEPLSRYLPGPRWPTFRTISWRELLGPAFAIGMMGAVEAIAIGKALATRAGHPFNASQQLIGEGLCNLAAGAVGGFASSGSFSRTAVNHEAGAVTRVSCILSGALVLVIVLVFAPQANAIPIAALAGTLVHIGIKLVNVARLRALFRTTSGDRLVLVVTFIAVVFAEHLEKALFVGIATSMYSALRRAEGFKLRALSETPEGGLREDADLPEDPDAKVVVLNLQGELYFAAAEELQAELGRRVAPGRVLVVRVQEAYNMDVTVAEALGDVAAKARNVGGRLVLCGVRVGMYQTFANADLVEAFGADALFREQPEVLASTKAAVAYAHRLVDRAADSGTTLL
ncbi:MAG: SulP family inorganic anion transporter [Polyangiales bacterium]